MSNFFGSSQPAGGLFGASTGSLFTSTPAKPASNLFAAPASKPPALNLFGSTLGQNQQQQQQPQQQQTGSLFGQTGAQPQQQSGSIFGQNNAQQQQQQQQPGILFGATQQQPAAGNMFGQSGMQQQQQQQQQQAPFGGSLFAPPPAPQPAPLPRLGQSQWQLAPNPRMDFSITLSIYTIH
jgi:hypothetical protein